METFHLQQNLDITNLDITSLYITNLYISNLYITNLDITKFYITNLDITKYLGITNVFFTPVIVKYMKKNLVIANILICQSLGPSRFHCTYNSWVQTVHNKKIISSRKSWNSKQQDIQIRSRSNIKIFRGTVFYPSTCLTLYLAKADTAMLFSSLSCLICSFKYLEK